MEAPSFLPEGRSNPRQSLQAPRGSPAAEIKDKEDVMWYFKTLQLALALAIIHSKPPDKSSKEYAVLLANTISGQDAKWKMRAEALETEVLCLRQQLVLNRIASGISIKNSLLPLTSQSVALSSTPNCSGPFEDSGCDLSGDCIADTQESLPAFCHSKHDFSSSSPVILSNALPKLTSWYSSKSESVVLHMQFLQRFLELRKLTESNGLKIDLAKLGTDCFVVSNSFSRLLDCLVISYKLPEQTFPDFMTQAVSVITNLLNDTDFSCQIFGKYFKKLEDTVETFVKIILNSCYLNRFQMQESISKALVLFGQCSALRSSTISLLFREVSQFAIKLQHANKIQDTYSVQYENIFFLCSILEQLLGTQTEQENKGSPGYEEKEKKRFLQNLDQAIFHLSDEFPLFCIYLWRLGTLLNAAQIGGKNLFSDNTYSSWGGKASSN